MCPDVEELIIKYCQEMDSLRSLLKDANQKYGFLNNVKFRDLDDVVSFTRLGQQELQGASLIMFSDSECGCRKSRDTGVWFYNSSQVLTVFSVLNFVRDSGLLCRHESVRGLQIQDDIVSVLTKTA